MTSKLWRLTQIEAETEIPQRTLPEYDEQGRRAGIQEWVGPVPVRASTQCPICVRKDPHGHGEEELHALRGMVAFLESKLGATMTSKLNDEGIEKAISRGFACAYCEGRRNCGPYEQEAVLARVELETLIVRRLAEKDARFAPLREFYSVDTDAELIAAQEKHIQKLQDKLAPTRDENPRTPRA